MLFGHFRNSAVPGRRPHRDEMAVDLERLLLVILLEYKLLSSAVPLDAYNRAATIEKARRPLIIVKSSR
jgi:hypothetical protein